MKELSFRGCRLDQAVQFRLKAAAEELSEVKGERYNLAKALFGKIIAARTEDLVIAVVSTNSRPLKISIIAVDTSGGVYIPSIREGDLELLTRKFFLLPEFLKRVKSLAFDDEKENFNRRSE